MTQITTISEFLLQAGTQYRVYDMARGIRHISEQTFLELESGLTKPAFPRQQHTWFGIVFWRKQLSKQHYIWFLKLPLDEQGYVVVATRNHFLQLIIDALGQQLEHAESQAVQLPENPYSFIPTQTQLANFNSISRMDLALPDSEYFQLAVDYIKHPLGKEWQQLAMQGLSDFAAHTQHLVHKNLLDLFIRNLAVSDQNTNLFAPLFRDLVQIPKLREFMLQLLRKPDKDRALTLAIGKLLLGKDA